MKKILIGAMRSKGKIEAKEGKAEVLFDNMLLYIADYNDGECIGFSVKNSRLDRSGKTGYKPIKIKTNDFEEVTGIKPGHFLKEFSQSYLFHKVRVRTEENDYGDSEVTELEISKALCFDEVSNSGNPTSVRFSEEELGFDVDDSIPY